MARNSRRALRASGVGPHSPDWGQNPDTAEKEIKSGRKDAAAEIAKCNAKKSDGTPCKQKAGFGTDHEGYGRCRFHGGTNPIQRRAAAEQEAIHNQVLFGAPVGIEPHQALIQELARTNGAIMLYQDALNARVANLQASGGLEGGELFDAMDPKTHALLKLYNEERDRMSKIARASLDLGLKERQVQMLEALAAGILQVVNGTLKSLGFTPEQVEQARPHVREQLQLVAAGQTTP